MGANHSRKKNALDLADVAAEVRLDTVLIGVVVIVSVAVVVTTLGVAV